LGPQSSSEGPELARVQCNAARFLNELAIDNDDNKIMIRSAGAVEALNRLLQSSTDKDVKSVALDALEIING